MRGGYGFGPSRRRGRDASAPLADYGWAVDFANGHYRNGSQFVTDVTTLGGYSFARASSLNEQAPGGAVSSFASNVPAILPGYGYVQRATTTNLLLNAGQASPLATQNVSLTAGTSYTLSFIDTGSVTISGAATGTLAGTDAAERVRMTVAAGSSGTATLTVTGDVRWAVLSGTILQGPIIPTGSTAATAPGGDLRFVPPDLSADWLMISDIDFLETTTLAGDEAAVCLSDGSSSNYLLLCRHSSATLRSKRNVGCGGVVNGPTLVSMPGLGKCVLALRKTGDVFSWGAIPAGGSYLGASLGALTGWGGPFSRLDVGKGTNGFSANMAIRFIGLETGTFSDTQMQLKAEARL